MSNPSPIDGFRDVAEAVRQSLAIIEAGHITLQAPVLTQADADEFRVRHLRLFGELIFQLSAMEQSLNQAVEAAGGTA